MINFNNVNHYRDFLSLEDICLAINVLMRIMLAVFITFVLQKYSKRNY